MPEYRFTDGNLLILYLVHRGKSTSGNLPDYINERIKLGLETYRIIMRSKPDKHKTMILIVGSSDKTVKDAKNALVKEGVDERIIAMDSESENVAETFDRVASLIKNKPNPPHIYFVGSVWLRDIYDSNVLSKFKGYRVQFEGALDHRPVKEVEQEKLLDVPKKGSEYYKRKVKDKAVDVLLNYIFPDNK